MFYPGSQLFNPMTLAAPPPEPKDLRALPSINLKSSTDSPATSVPGAGTDSDAAALPNHRLQLEIRLPGPGWGFLNVTGPLLAWSFTEVLPVATDPQVSQQCQALPACGKACL